jgi:hypothetical protein
MASTASGVTIPGNDPSSTAATPIQDHWNNLGKSLNALIIVPTASVTTRAALVTARNAEGPAISASAPLRVHRADAPVGLQLEVTTDGTTWENPGPKVLPREGISGAAMPSTGRPLTQAFPAMSITTAGGLLAITFPVAFAAPPVVVAMTVNYIANNPIIPSGQITATGCNLYFPANPSATVLVNVIAVGWV